MPKRPFFDPKLLLLLFVALGVKLFSLREDWVEQFYTYGVYPPLSRLFRGITGWVPFSLGDLLYLAAGIYLVVKTAKIVSLIRRKVHVKLLLRIVLGKLLRLALYVYLLFNLFWGLNYNRQGIAHQLQLNVKPYSLQDLDTLTSMLQARLNGYAGQVDSGERVRLQGNRALFDEAKASFVQVERTLPFLAYRTPSVKPSLYSGVGHLFGFSGYYNPFSGEAQVNTRIPFFIKPFVVVHEIGHQLGYAKENEANFVAFFAGRSSRNPEFRYSVYYEMYLYAAGEMARRDSLLARTYRDRLHPRVKLDNKALEEYLNRSANLMEPVIAAFYDTFLKWNNQPKGKMTYNEVVAWLIAYQKKYGRESI